MTINIRRVVTGHDEHGKAVVRIDDWVFRMMTLVCSHATFPRLPYESACNSNGSMFTKRQ
jgi:hypothetical protein